MKIRGIGFIMTMFFATALAVSVSAREPEKPVVDYPLESHREAKIVGLDGLKPKEVVQKLKDIDFVIDEPSLHKAIFKAFKHRRTEAVNLALEYLQLSPVGMDDGTPLNRNTELFIAKKILQVFPEEAVAPLLELYKNGDTTTKANILRASGSLPGGEAIRNLLVQALEDKSATEEGQHPEAVGTPLRLCDIAYNQLVLREDMRDILRTIGTTHRIETRDHNIEILQGRVK